MKWGSECETSARAQCVMTNGRMKMTNKNEFDFKLSISLFIGLGLYLFYDERIIDVGVFVMLLFTFLLRFDLSGLLKSE